MVLDIKGNESFGAGEKPSRAALAKGLLSVSSVVPVANATARTQLVQGLSTASLPVGSSRPLVVSRADARAMHSLEVSRDGNVFLPVSGVLQFASKTAANTWASANGGLLSYGDQAALPNALLWWNGSKWLGDAPTTPSLGEVSGVTYSAASDSAPMLRADRGYANGEGIVVSSLATFDAGTTYSMGQIIPAAFLPAKPVVLTLAILSTTFARIRLQTNGTLLFQPDKTIRGTLEVGLDPLRYLIG
ncbi:hypothetical protein FHS07_001907 [Microbacterium proteolyticum]|uniref:Uncharacterized protein n=1 Tax=Microbacterium proteolyticum TaxID=1572644 RepID=A0A7W5CID3_9MICO|nr:hypothetical protein [Microbacterium proteolyticum]MBB3158211.1 hypothetical protein [Microbacterium proteolyticum]